MNAALKNRINRYLASFDLPKLDDPNLLGPLAYCVRDHEHFRSLLLMAEPEERRNMYDALAPNLRFQPRTLEEYMAEAADQAEREQLPWIARDGTLQQYYPPEVHTQSTVDAEAIAQVLTATIATVVLTVRCRKCTREAQFAGTDKWSAVQAAREAGWVYSTFNEGIEICPECP